MVIEGKVKNGKFYSTCMVEIEQKGEYLIIGNSFGKFEVKAEDVAKALHRDDKSCLG